MTAPGEPRLRTLQVDAGREWRGGQRQVRLLLRRLRERPDVEVALATRAGSRLAREGHELGIPVAELPWATGLDPRGALRLVKLLSEPPDIVHAHDSHALQTAWVAVSAVGSPSALVATRRVLFAPAGPALWRRPELVLAVSGAVRDRLLRAGLEPARVRVVHDALDPRAVSPEGPGRIREGPGRIRAAAGIPADATLVGAVGALERGKGHDVLVRAAARVLARVHARGLRGAEVHFVVVGEGREREALERRVATAGIGERFHLPGHLPDVARSLGELDLFVMPSTEEGFGSAALEAMAAGVPAVLARAGGLRDLAGDGLPAVPPGDPEALAAVILRLLRSGEARREVREAGRRRLERFGPERMVERTRAAYREVLASRRRRWATEEWENRLQPLRRARLRRRRRGHSGREGPGG